MREVVEGGHIYLAKPPLFLIKLPGNKREYVYTEEDLDRWLRAAIEKRRANGATIDPDESLLKQAGLNESSLQRYKGLGEMDAVQLSETTMNPENRVLVQVNVEDAERADVIFTKLMGDDVALRKNFIQTRAKEMSLEELDV